MPLSIRLPDCGSEQHWRRDLALVEREFATGLPAYDVRVFHFTPPLEDGLGGGSFMQPFSSWTGEKVVLKNIRKDFLYGVVSVAREIGSGGYDLVVGIGQGALVALLFSRPRVVEAALAASHTQPQEFVGMAWASWCRSLSASSHYFDEVENVY